MHIKQLLKFSLQKNASDLHLSPNLPPIIRLDGELIFLNNFPLLTPQTIQEIIKNLMNKDQHQKFNSKLEIDFSHTIPQLGRFRINIFKQIHGIAVVFRIIPETIPKLDDVNFPSIFKKIVSLSSGLVLVTGATGCGKSTTIASMIDYLNHSQSRHIITLEDPVEYIHHSHKSLINQREIGQDSLTFKNALKSALREDPDVIMIGEMRDIETMRLALRAAETGHLVLSTLHTRSAATTISRIIESFPSGEQNSIQIILSNSIQAVICQTLIKKREGGRIAAFEIMLATSAIRNLIRENKIAQMNNFIQTNHENGMCTLEQYKQKLIANKLIISDEASIGL